MGGKKGSGGWRGVLVLTSPFGKVNCVEMKLLIDGKNGEKFLIGGKNDRKF